MIRKLIAVFVCLSLAALLFAAGSSESAADTASKYELHDPRPELKVLMGSSSVDYNTRPEALRIEELTGYHVIYDRLPSENTDQALALTLAGGNNYDAVVTGSQSMFSSLMTNGALLPLNDYIDNITPEFWDALPEIFWEGVSDENGLVYALPFPQPRPDTINSNFVIRMDLVRAAGIDELPTTLGAFYEMLRTLKDFYGDEYIILTGPFWRNVSNNPFPVDMCLASAFGIYNDWMVDDDGNVIYMTEHPRFAEMMNFYLKLKDEGILDPDFAINSYHDANERMASGKAIITFNGLTSGADTVYSAILELGLEAEDIAFLGPLEGDDGTCKFQNTMAYSTFTVVPVNNRGYTADLFDWFKRKYENQREISIGIEGVHHYIGEDGFPTPIQPTFNDEMNQGYSYHTIVNYETYADEWIVRAKKTPGYWLDYEAVTLGAKNERPWILVPAYFSLCGSPAYLANKSVLTANLCDYLLQLIAGTKTLDSSLGTFMSDQRNEGLEEVRAELQEWYDANYR